MATTWSLSFEKVLQAAPVAIELLHLFAFLYPDAIPEEIISEGSVHMGSLLQPIAHDQLQLDLALSEMLKYSLISRHPESYTFTIHRLVQAVFKASMSHDIQHIWAIRAVQAMGDTFPSVEFSTWHRCQRYLLHAQTCATLIEEWELNFPNAARLLNQTAAYLRVRGQYAEAEPLYHRALIIWQQALGSLHSNVTAALNNLACLYKDWGKYEPVEELYQLAQAIWEQTDGQDHLYVAISLANPADLSIIQGKYESAEPLYQRSLAIRLQKLGPQHPDTATIFHKLAGLYLHQNHHEQAEALYQQAYAIRQQTLGLGHPVFTMSKASTCRLSCSIDGFSRSENKDRVPGILRLLMRLTILLYFMTIRADTKRLSWLIKEHTPFTSVPLEIPIPKVLPSWVIWQSSIVHKAGTTRQSHSSCRHSLFKNTS